MKDLGVKVTRKKSYNVSTFQGAGLPPPPIHYLLRRPCVGQSPRAERSVSRAGGPMGSAAALPHVAARARPSPRPRPSGQGELGGGGAGAALARPRAPPARAGGHSYGPQQRAGGPRGIGVGRGRRGVPLSGGAAWGRALSQRREGQEAGGPPPASVREAAASGSGRRSSRFVAGRLSGGSAGGRPRPVGREVRRGVGLRAGPAPR